MKTLCARRTRTIKRCTSDARTPLADIFSILVGKEGAVKARIHVTLKQGILDPQGKAIEHALDSLGFKNVGNVRVGKYMEVDVDEKDKVKAEAEVKAMCEKLLANTIVEEYRYELTP
ncbi:MAG: phosphoribosylformylglycinamidine synthase [Nitrospira sp.]|nr:MAG: phosphoribosylformylglycinamidine synthase [Nitrospira sp.]